MASSGQSVLCVYRYDPLDRLADCSPAGQGSTRFFYQKTHLATQIQGQAQHSLMRTDEQLLACLSAENNQRDGVLLATDQQQSVTVAQGLEFAYTPYGHRHPSGTANLPGFTGQRVDPVTGHYLLGNGYRAFNPVLMRFNSPDSLSPFGEGGVNAYGYCGGDPVNWVDWTGSTPALLKGVLRFLKVMKPSRRLSSGNVTGTSLQPLSDGINSGLSTSAPQLSHSAAVRQVELVSVSVKKLNKEAGLDSVKAAKEFKANDKLYSEYIDKSKKLKSDTQVGLSFYDEDDLVYEYTHVQQYIREQRKLANPIQDLSTPPSYKLAREIKGDKELELIMEQIRGVKQPASNLPR
ncbi:MULTISPECIES: RHS repeat-associated core domain-containing protein [Pseudomonas]|uniref:RHS repeat-associated core domain-containing protein n=1 Tax=Pseudomonas TaxID=286 RepID=UPI000CD2C512|nr:MULTISPECIES: RHS repeat-associated core domain-containing protein [Pseudomonas]MCF4984237.1 RHS repeat-associated core domain-containing protein [Pseudomonas syringae]MCF5271191.1 RHS repeat-associated core domain-containing protein [Pseudomonas syringae]MCF5274827.1 RHS repeat-associated core domain-containing protein [Pseudomonas syringae]MCF5279177.1 RHS repeat-associated core domain-containing protein [Pseudomonas syringae]MCF5291544.1 RHS repeat-associated core domain-containing prote